MTEYWTDPETGVIYWRDENGILRPRELTNTQGEVVGYEQASGFFPSRVGASGKGPLLDPLAMPPEELARLKAEGYSGLIAKPRRMDDVPGYRRDW